MIPSFIVFIASIIFGFISSGYELLISIIAFTSVLFAIFAQMSLNRCPNCDLVILKLKVMLCAQQDGPQTQWRVHGVRRS